MKLPAWLNPFNRWNQAHRDAWRDWTTPGEGGLSRFQRECERSLVQALAEHGLRLGERNLRHAGDGSLYVHARVAPTMLQVEIYVDTANVLDTRWHSDQCFEEWGFQTPAELITRFIAAAQQRGAKLAASSRAV